MLDFEGYMYECNLLCICGWPLGLRGGRLYICWWPLKWGVGGWGGRKSIRLWAFWTFQIYHQISHPMTLVWSKSCTASEKSLYKENCDWYAHLPDYWQGCVCMVQADYYNIWGLKLTKRNYTGSFVSFNDRLLVTTIRDDCTNVYELQ